MFEDFESLRNTCAGPNRIKVTDMTDNSADVRLDITTKTCIFLRLNTRREEQRLSGQASIVLSYKSAV